MSIKLITAPKFSLDVIAEGKLDEIKVFVTTWNMGNAESIGFSTVFTEKHAFEDYDIFAIGLQESTYSSKSKSSGANFDSIAHLTAVLETIFGSRFYIVEHCYRVQLQLFVFAKKALKARITCIEKSIENTGFLHVFPNKGGLLVTFHIDGTKFAFISCHLTAHEGVKHCEDRNASIVEILGGVRAEDKRFDVTEQFHHVWFMGDMNYRLTYDKKTPGNSKKNLPSSMSSSADPNDVQLQMSVTGKTSGDLCDDSDSDAESDEEGLVTKPPRQGLGQQAATGEGGDGEDKSEMSSDKKSLKKKDRAMKMQRTMEMIVNEQWSDLMLLDELNREINAGRVLNGFVPLEPSFYPTFKRNRNLSIIPNRKGPKGSYIPEDKKIQDFYNEKRMPSFTDRILYKSLPAFAAHVKPIFFEACEQAMSSDHKPVRAGFTVKITRGSDGIFLDKNILKWKGKPSGKTSGRRTDVHMMRVVVSDLRGENLEEMDSQMFGGGSDPYIIITTDPDGLMLNKGTLSRLERDGVKSKVIKHDLNPVWTDNMHFSLSSLDLAGLAQSASLIFSVWDEDVYNSDDLIGVVSFPLRDIILSNASNGSFKFASVDLLSNSEVMGKLSGTITIEDSIEVIHESYCRLPSDRCVSLSAARAMASNSAVGCACTLM